MAVNTVHRRYKMDFFIFFFLVTISGSVFHTVLDFNHTCQNIAGPHYSHRVRIILNKFLYYRSIRSSFIIYKSPLSWVSFSRKDTLQQHEEKE